MGPVFAAVGAESGKQALRYALHAEQAGCSVSHGGSSADLFFVDRWTYRLLPRARRRHLATDHRQDASAYVGNSIPMQVYASLLDRYGPERILFKPEAAPIGPNLSELRDMTRGTAQIFEGSGGILLIDSYRRGIKGTMPGMDLLDGIVQLWYALQNDDDKRAYAIYYPICAIVTLQLKPG